MGLFPSSGGGSLGDRPSLVGPFDDVVVALVKKMANLLIKSVPKGWDGASCKIGIKPAVFGINVRCRVWNPVQPGEHPEVSKEFRSMATQLIRHWTREGRAFPQVQIDVYRKRDQRWNANFHILDGSSVTGRPSGPKLGAPIDPGKPSDVETQESLEMTPPPAPPEPPPV